MPLVGTRPKFVSGMTNVNIAVGCINAKYVRICLYFNSSSEKIH